MISLNLLIYYVYKMMSQKLETHKVPGEDSSCPTYFRVQRQLIYLYARIFNHRGWWEDMLRELLSGKWMDWNRMDSFNQFFHSRFTMFRWLFYTFTKILFKIIKIIPTNLPQKCLGWVGLWKTQIFRMFTKFLNYKIVE